ncbi:hypothetical protein [Methyloraptor flagellatus]|jgi:hypothetical protein|uniref:DUF4148 domain-containing protein n=1 Tax=Methyloraptor flagellatus TaxID=3162530 RepID=A0AAU7X4S2_9HYPH
MKTIRFALAALAIGASATAAFADSDTNGFNSSFVREAAPVSATATVIEGRQAATIEGRQTARQSSLDAADAIRLQRALDSDRSADNHD